jgi:putative colanic acid biosynthesis UDP-glucose lipid carrier transferase
VGPRPHAVAHDRVYRATLPGYDRRFAVKPGITGLAQIRGFRGPTASVEDAARRLSADLEYIREWSIPGDLRVLIKSAGVLVRHGGC